VQKLQQSGCNNGGVCASTKSSAAAAAAAAAAAGAKTLDTDEEEVKRPLMLSPSEVCLPNYRRRLAMSVHVTLRCPSVRPSVSSIDSQ